MTYPLLALEIMIPFKRMCFYLTCFMTSGRMEKCVLIVNETKQQKICSGTLSMLYN